MSSTVILINSLAAILLLAAFWKDRAKAVKSLKVAVRAFMNIIPSVMLVIVLVGIVFGVFSLETIAEWLGERSGYLGILLTGVVGSVLHIPSLIAFPLAGSLLEGGSSAAIIATFVATLTMIGFVTFPMEAKELGKKFALLRNGLSFIAALIIGWLMGIIL